MFEEQVHSLRNQLTVVKGRIELAEQNLRISKQTIDVMEKSLFSDPPPKYRPEPTEINSKRNKN